MTHVGHVFIMASIVMGTIGMLKYAFDRDLAAFDIRLGITVVMVVLGSTLIYFGG